MDCTLDPFPSEWSRYGYEFSGWNTQPDGSGESYSDGQQNVNFLENVTLYAKWTKTSWTISYNMNGHGTVPDNAWTEYVPENLPYVPPSP